MTAGHEQPVSRLLVLAAGVMRVVLALLGTGCGSGNSAIGGDYVMTVKRMIEVEGRVDDAIALLEERSERSPAAGPTWYWLGIAYQRKGRHQEAVTALDRAFTCDRPRLSETWYPTAYSHRGWAHYHLHDFPKAGSDFDDALAIAVSPAMRQDALRGRGWVRHQLGRYQEATTDFSEALGLIDPGNRAAQADALSGRGAARLRLRDFPGTLSDLDRAIGLTDPRNTALQEQRLRSRAWARYYLGDFEGALQDVNLALPMIPAGQGVPLYECAAIQAFAYLALGRDREALEAVDRGRTVGSSLPFGTNRDLAMVYLVQGEREKAFSLWGGAAWLGVELQDYREGEVTGAKIISLSPRSPAGAAGLVPNDVIVAIGGQAVANSADVIEQIALLKPGQKIQVDIIRDGPRSGQPVTLGSVETLMATMPILAPVLKVRPLPPALPFVPVANQTSTPIPAPAGGESTTDASPVSSSSLPAVSEPTVQEATVEIDGITITPNPVSAGGSFSLQIDLYAEDPREKAEVISVALSRTITRDGEVIARFKPERIEVPNGGPKTEVKNMRASKTPGHYTIEIELALEDKITKRAESLTIQ